MHTSMIGSILVAAGLVTAGWLVGNGIQQTAAMKRVIEVRGLAEREVRADYAVWNLAFTADGNTVNEGMESVARQRQTITDYLVKRGFKPEEITRGNITLHDNWAEGRERAPQRYLARARVILGTRDIASVEQAEKSLEEIFKAGVQLEYPSIHYRYTQLNSIKPAMLTEATVNAKAAADSFARDSGATITGLSGATQGLFSIVSANGDYDDPASVMKKVRVVTQMRYTIK